MPNHRPEPYFNPRSPCGERPPPWSCLSGQRTDFNPRSPCGERPDNWRGGLTWVGISIHAPRAGSDKCFPRPRVVQVGISIHAPRAGSDDCTPRAALPSTNFNPRSPCGERPRLPFLPRTFRAFQSTLPVRGATRLQGSVYFSALGISIHAPRAGSDKIAECVCDSRQISIHAPRAGSDDKEYKDALKEIISIHAPRAGSDNMDRRGAACLSNISIHAPRAGSDDDYPTVTMAADGISIHAPRAGSDCNGCGWNIPPRNFNPRSPCGERRAYRKENK